MSANLEKDVGIANHFSASLSELDLQIVRAVPPGGNWKNIPLDIPSKRLAQIRDSFRAGKGSRSTYYGRLDPTMPSFTIGTYFSRPGNGCGMHYEQDRMLSQREAARLQSFPDSFRFIGSQTAVNKQVGNAVPPLLAFQIARGLGDVGVFVDLFAGAGGLALGFSWAGWRHLAANELEPGYASTYETNIGGPVVVGDIRDPDVRGRLTHLTAQRRRTESDAPFVILGGPPCQGFSTAGKRRSMEDERNHLFKSYADVLRIAQPDYFIFENVPGIVNMEAGRVLKEILAALGEAGFYIDLWRLKAEEFGIPQRRTRVFIVGHAPRREPARMPTRTTTFGASDTLFSVLPPTLTVRDALDDLPVLVPGQNGSTLPYRREPSTPYQQLMRGRVTADDFLKSL